MCPYQVLPWLKFHNWQVGYHLYFERILKFFLFFTLRQQCLMLAILGSAAIVQVVRAKLFEDSAYLSVNCIASWQSSRRTLHDPDCCPRSHHFHLATGKAFVVVIAELETIDFSLTIFGWCFIEFYSTPTGKCTMRRTRCEIDFIIWVHWSLPFQWCLASLWILRIVTLCCNDF